MTRKGQKQTEETKNKIRLANLGHSRGGWKLSNETIKKMKGKTPWNKNKKGLQVAWNKNKPRTWVSTGDFKKGQKPWNLGKKMIKISKCNHYNWKGGITPLMQKIRVCFEYRQWRSDVFKRDDYTCQDCSKNKTCLNADHIKPFSIIIQEYSIKTLEEALNCVELWDINNGRTLCIDCHRKTDTYKSKARNYKNLEK